MSKKDEILIMPISDAFYMYLKTVIIGKHKVDINDFMESLVSYMIETLESYSDIDGAIEEFTQSIDTWLGNEVYHGDLETYHQISDASDNVFYHVCMDIYYYLYKLESLPTLVISKGDYIILKFKDEIC